LSKLKIEVVVLRTGYQERRVVFGEGIAHFGRAEDNDLVLADIGVSRRHARLVVNANGVFVEDMGSGNGTFFDGNRINRQPVQNGDEVVIDPFSLRFVMPEREVETDDGLTGELEDVEDDDTAEVPLAPLTHPTFDDQTNHRVSLVTLQGQRLAPSYPIRGTGLSIGRSEARDVILFDPAASRNHALLESVGGSIWLRDHGSGNGTFVNGLRVREQCLRHGDRIRVGSTEFRFEVQDAPRPEPPTMPPSDALAEVVKAARAERRIPAPDSVTERQFPPPTPVRGPRVVMFAALASFTVVAMMILGALLMMYVIEPQINGRGEAFAVAAVEVPPESADAFARHLDRGESAFDEGQFLGAASQYYTALKLAPGHPQAERMAHVSCEYLALDTLRAGIVLQGLSSSEKRALQSKAVRLAKNAVRGRASAKAARAALMDVLVFMPGDKRSRGLLEQLKGK
jgi:pSer/pThr/pTyr-binding forkhead associated (FHA) protein